MIKFHDIKIKAPREKYNNKKIFLLKGIESLKIKKKFDGRRLQKSQNLIA